MDKKAKLEADLRALTQKRRMTDEELWELRAEVARLEFFIDAEEERLKDEASLPARKASLEARLRMLRGSLEARLRMLRGQKK